MTSQQFTAEDFQAALDKINSGVYVFADRPIIRDALQRCASPSLKELQEDTGSEIMCKSCLLQLIEMREELSACAVFPSEPEFICSPEEFADAVWVIYHCIRDKEEYVEKLSKTIAERDEKIKRSMSQKEIGLLDPDMPGQELRLHMGEITPNEALVARAAIRWANSKRVPDGMVLVPREPTEEMLNAGLLEFSNGYIKRGGDSWRKLTPESDERRDAYLFYAGAITRSSDEFKAVYRAMITAAEGK